MYQIDNEKFGRFLTQLRKDKNFTQKDLADRLFVSDKTVSKWERGLSFPNVSLLIPLADILGVTVTELLKGEPLHESSLNMAEVESLVTYSVDLSVQEQFALQKRNKKWTSAFFICAAAAAAEILFFLFAGIPVPDSKNILFIEGLLFFMGGWFCLFAKEKLPAYYDENQIHFVSDGIFRINMIGLHFNNSNWPHILNTGRIWTLAAVVLYPAVWWIFYHIMDTKTWKNTELFFMLPVILGIFVSFYIVGKKYE